MQMIQTHLSQGTSNMVVWLPQDKRVKCGVRLTLEKAEGIWNVEEQFGVTASEGIQRGWGLALPKSYRTEK